MFNIVNTVSNAVVVSTSEKSDADIILAQIDTTPSTHEIVEVADVAE